MEYPIGRGNKIIWQYKDTMVNVIDHCYNSSPQSLRFMMDQSQSYEGFNIIIFTPFRECADLNNVYEEIKIFVTSDNFWLYNPGEETIPLKCKQFLTQENIMEALLVELNNNHKKINIFIKGANFFKMIYIVVNTLEILGNNI